MNAAVLEIIERGGHLVLDEPVELRSRAALAAGRFVDGTRALAQTSASHVGTE